MEGHILRQALDVVADSIAVVDVQQPGLPIIYVNKPFTRLNGWSATEIIGQHCGLLQEHAQHLTPDDDIVQVILDRRELRLLLYKTLPNTIPAWHELFLSPLPNDIGQITHYVIVQTDVTERFQNRREVLFTQVALDNAREAIFIVDAQGMILEANRIASERLEYTLAEFQAMHFYDLDSTYRAKEWPTWWEKLKAKKLLTLEGVNRSKSGREFPVEVVSSTFTFGGETYCCAFVRD